MPGRVRKVERGAGEQGGGELKRETRGDSAVNKRRGASPVRRRSEGRGVGGRGQRSFGRIAGG